MQSTHLHQLRQSFFFSSAADDLPLQPTSDIPTTTGNMHITHQINTSLQTLFVIQKLSSQLSRQRCIYQGCGLGLDVSVSRRSRDIPTSRLGLDQNAQRLGLVSVSDLCVLDLVSVSTQNVSGLVEGLGPFRLVETFHAGAPNLTTILQ